jgi:hypothetical protein
MKYPGGYPLTIGPPKGGARWGSIGGINWRNKLKKREEKRGK